MTFFAGIFSRNVKQVVPPSACEALKGAISRHPHDEISIFKDDRSFFVKVDIGAYQEPAFRTDSDGSVSMLAGDPLLADGDADDWHSRTRDLDLLHEGWKKGDWNPLTRARGVFCAFHYKPDIGTLSLIADKLCLRPLYYWISDDCVIFATALRILESLNEIPKEMDLRALTEMVTLGLPLGTRTPYANVRLLRAAEVVQVGGEKISQWQYWRWDKIRQSPKPEPELLAEVRDRFNEAVALRIRRDTATAAFLSGGLDSRCIVAALRARKTQVHTFNFAPSGTQDQVFGAEFARKVGTIHGEAPVNTYGSPNWSMIMAEAWAASEFRSKWPPERHNLVWSGDGGSVGFGHVYASRAIVELMRAGRVDDAIEQFILQQRAHVPQKLFRADFSEALSKKNQIGIREELTDIHSDDPGRSFHIFLLLNDQRRHLVGHFENIDLHRLEFQLPFYDSDFLASIVSIPIDLCLGHRFYLKWLKYLSPTVSQIPWQAYPGHEPCPLPIPPELSYQWESQQHKSRKRELLNQAAQMLTADDFPRKILNKRYLRIATLVYKAGLRDYAYVIQAANTYNKYWGLCGGNFVLDHKSVPTP